MSDRTDGRSGADRAGAVRRAPIARLRLLLDIDLHILQTLLLRGWSIIAGGVMVLFVPRWFGPVDQGYFYTFNSLIAVQIFFELGMNQIVVQIVGHEAAHLRQQSDGSLVGDRAPIARLASLTRLLTRWYQVAALLFFVLGGAAGLAFFAWHGVPGGREAGIWLVLVLLTAINLALSPALAMLEGLGRVGDVARLRLVQSIVGYGLMWAALSFGAGLFAAPLLAGAGVLCTAYWLHAHDRRIRWLKAVQLLPDDQTLKWRRDILPLQWRIALSWASGYLILQLLVPMTFSHQGAVAAGQLGLTLTIFNSLLSIGLSWVNARLPVLAGHLARNERQQARAGFWSVSVRSTGITMLGSLMLVIAVQFLPDFMRSRFADVTTMACLAIATVVNCVIYAMATFIRAHKEEPLLAQSIVCALVMAPAVYVSSYLDVATMTATFAAVIVILSLPWTIAIFRRYYARSAA